MKNYIVFNISRETDTSKYYYYQNIFNESLLPSIIKVTSEICIDYANNFLYLNFDHLLFETVKSHSVANMAWNQILNRDYLDENLPIKMLALEMRDYSYTLISDFTGKNFMHALPTGAMLDFESTVYFDAICNILRSKLNPMEFDYFN